MNYKITRVFVLLFVMFFAISVFASETVGTVNNTNKYAWAENMGWINFAVTNGGTYSGLTISDTTVTGYAWSDQFGWINFNPTNSGQGVLNTSDGQLSGSAWVASLGWLPMDGVTINSSGKFVGTAGVEGSTVGRVSFDCDNCNVTTDWRPLSARTVLPSTTGGGVVFSSGSTTGSNGTATTTGNTDTSTSTSGGTTQNGATTGGNTIPPVITVEQNNGPDPIGDLYSFLELSEPSRTPASDYVESYDAPLAISPTQHGLLAYKFSDGSSALVIVPKGVSDDGMTIDVRVAPAVPGDDGPFTFVFGGIKFNVTAKDSHGNALHHFSHPLQITLSIPTSLVGEKDLGVYWLDTTTSAWIHVPDVAFAGTTATFSVDHLTEFAILKAKGLPDRIAITSAKVISNSHQYNYWFLWILLLLIVIYIYLRSKKERKV